MKLKRFFQNIKIAFVIFSVCFTVLFLLFSFDAIFSIIKYKIKNFRVDVYKELSRPIDFSLEKTHKTLPVNITYNNVSNNNHVNPLPTKEPLPEIPSEAVSENILVLPKFNIVVPILEVPNENQKIIYQALRKGVLVYPTTDSPGINSNYTIILGHSSRYPWEPGRYKSVFSLLNELEPKDRFYIFWNQRPLVYEVQDKNIFIPYPKGEDYTENIFPPKSNEKILILQSCWPVGVDYKRIAIKAVLINW